MMFDRSGDLCVLSTAGTIAYENWESLFKNILSVATFFGFRSFPDELKIKIQMCNEEEFKQKKEEFNMNVPDYAIAFTCKINRIFILEYRNINRWYSLNAYDAVIVHECIHVFQMYFSMISPKQYAWLYESVACYLAKQKKAYNRENKVLWETFIHDFYKINDCYSLAYNFGIEIFKRFGNDILRVIRRPEAYIVELMEVYNSKILGENIKGVEDNGEYIRY